MTAMIRSHFQRPRIARATAWFLILLCAWMGTDGVLHHTEAGLSSHGTSHAHHRTVAAPADNCAACEWTQGMQTGTMAVCRVPLPFFAVIPNVLPLIRRITYPVSRRSSPRAPPILVTA
jgi:hypothetical protein